MRTPEKKFTSLANIFVQLLYFKNLKQKEVIKGNSHASFCLLACGSIEMSVDKVKTNYEAPHILVIPPKKQITITPLIEDTVVYNLHALRDENGVALDQNNVPGGVDLSDFGIDKSILENE